MKALLIIIVAVSMTWIIFFGFGFACMGVTAPHFPGDRTPGWVYVLEGQAWCVPAYLACYFAGRALRRRDRFQREQPGFEVLPPRPEDKPL